MSTDNIKFAIAVSFATFIAIGVAEIRHVVEQILQALGGG